jgi:hypothetical protein
MSSTRDSARTRRYIDEALGRFMQFRNVVERTYYAWVYLRGLRRLGDDDSCRSLGIAVPNVPTAPADLDLADAEHYMYARFLAGSTGDPTTNTLVAGYEVIKILRLTTGHEKGLRTDPRFPVLPPSISSVNWGMQGASDGLRDYKALHGGQLGRIGSALAANKQFANGQYQNAYSVKRLLKI